MKNPVVSVIMAVYNTKKEYLKEAIDSILNQTFKDFELVIINDGSTNPDVEKTIKSYTDKRIKYFVTQNSGASAARNYGLDKAIGKYIAIMDSDDISLPQRIEKQVAFLEEHPEITLISANMELFNEKGSKGASNVLLNPGIFDLLKTNPIQHSMAMWRKADFDKYHLRYKLEYLIAQDYELWTQAIRYFRIANLPDVLGRYRLVANSLSNSRWKLLRDEVKRARISLINFLTSDNELKQTIFDLIYKAEEQIKEHQFLLPRPLGKIICCFIPNKKNRQRFKRNHLKPKNEKMKIVKMQGGLGNQMFQWAFGRALGKGVAFDGTYFNNIVHENPKITQHPYALDFFCCDPEFVPGAKIKEYMEDDPLLKIFGIKTRLKTCIDTMSYNPKFLKVKKALFNGYWQSPKYCEPIRQQLLKDFVPRDKLDAKNQEIILKMKNVESVSLHVRRGDYVNLQEVHGLCGLEYYRKAIDYIASKIKNPHFFLFSDDVDWVKENLKIDYPFTVVDFNKKEKNPCDLWLMKHCKHNIIANSSFSWWGAWLNENPDKIVIAPQKWFANGTQTDIVPPEWIRL